MRTAMDDGEILSNLVSIEKLQLPKTGGATTTLSADAAVDDEELTFLKAGFSADDWILVDAGLGQMVYQIGAIPSGTEPIPLASWPVDRPHASGAAVKELVTKHLGYIEEGSATLTGSSSTASVGAANAGGRIWQGAPDVGDLGCSWGQRALSVENLLSAYGINEDNVRGDGTAGNPYRALVTPDLMGTQRDYAYLLRGIKKNTKTCKMLLMNPTPVVSVNTAFGAKNQPGVLTVGCIYTHKLMWDE